MSKPLHKLCRKKHTQNQNNECSTLKFNKLLDTDGWRLNQSWLYGDQMTSIFRFDPNQTAILQPLFILKRWKFITLPFAHNNASSGWKKAPWSVHKYTTMKAVFEIAFSFHPAMLSPVIRRHRRVVFFFSKRNVIIGKIRLEIQSSHKDDDSEKRERKKNERKKEEKHAKTFRLCKFFLISLQNWLKL